MGIYWILPPCSGEQMGLTMKHGGYNHQEQWEQSGFIYSVTAPTWWQNV